VILPSAELAGSAYSLSMYVSKFLEEHVHAHRNEAVALRHYSGMLLVGGMEACRHFRSIERCAGRYVKYV